MEQQALLVVSFGTSHDGTREKTIGALEREVASAYPSIPIRRAFTSKVFLRGLVRRGIQVDSVPQALDKLVEEGFSNVAVLSSHLIPGEEYDKLRALIEEYRPRFPSLSLTAPLLHTTGDLLAVAKAVLDRHPVAEGEALVLMGHGTYHPANSIYPALDFVFRDLGREDVFVGTVEGYPEVDSVLRRLQRAGYTKVLLVPLMLVAGDHAINDMAGEEPDSWKNQLEGAGIAVRCALEGLGEVPAIRELYLSHLREVL